MGELTLFRQDTTDLVALFGQFISDEVAGGMAAGDTARTYKRETEQYWGWCRERWIDPLTATREDVVAYRRWLIERYAPASVALKLSAVRRFYAAAKTKGLVAGNPAGDVRGPKRATTGVEYFSEGELTRILQAVPRDTVQGKRDLAILGLMGLQGLRVVEIVRLNVGDLRIVDERPHLRVTGKGGAEDLLPILHSLAEGIREQWAASGRDLSPEAPMFASTRNSRDGKRGERLTRGAVQGICATYFRRAGVTGHAHLLRHTAATLSLKHGADLRQVQAMLRHTDPKITAQYAHALNRAEENPALRIPVEV
jgi:site-specific recombinase XerD